MRAGERAAIEVVAPMAGTVVPLEDVPDPVFSGAVVGPGLALLPDEPAAGPLSDAGRVVVVAPCAGRVTGVYPHALMVQVDAERAVLVHLGLDTAQLGGHGFHVAVSEGERVAPGHPLMSWTPADVRSGGRSTLTPLVALQGRADDVVLLVEPDQRVEEGDALLLWV